MSKYETVAGHVTRGECYAKTLDLFDQLLDQTAIMAHLHATETSPKDRALAEGWRAMHHAFQLIRRQLTSLAQGNLQ
jgi:hypothetical protein